MVAERGMHDEGCRSEDLISDQFETGLNWSTVIDLHFTLKRMFKIADVFLRQKRRVKAWLGAGGNQSIVCFESRLDLNHMLFQLL